MAQTTIDRLIVNSPYEEPQYHWRYDRETRLFDLVDGRRPAGYVAVPESSKAFDDPGPGISNRQAVRLSATRLPLT